MKIAHISDIHFEEIFGHRSTHHLISVPKTGRERNIPMDVGDVLELLIRCETDLVLCGHKHVPWIWNLDGMIIANAGTACANRVKWN